MQSIGAATGIAKEYRSIFELGGVPAFNEFYNIGIVPWKCLYKGFYKPWHYVLAPTIADPDHHRNLFYTQLSKAVCSELAGMVWTDQCEVDVSMVGRDPASEEPDPLNEFVQDVLKKNAFQTKMAESVEQAEGVVRGPEGQRRERDPGQRQDPDRLRDGRPVRPYSLG